ncbi:MAG: hypothetical protein EPO28_00875 [Saprospiraceae bacterium]|nr:MAG: hypothetical protein EPO28_00875 [Saprospiraceae bacterium]
MRKKDLVNRNKILLQQLDVMHLLYDEFIEKLGHKGFQERVDEILDEYNLNNKLIKDLENGQ